MAYQRQLFEIKSGEPETFRIPGLDFLASLEFSGNSFRVANQHSPDNQPLPRVSFLLNRHDLRLLENARQSIDANLRVWPLADETRREVVEIALRTTREYVAGMPWGHNFFGLRFAVNLFDDWEIEEVMVWEGGVGMVPATEPSIENLERKKPQLPGSCCPVCMDEFSFDCEVVCMPCSHHFHGDCIKEWLRTSHYCPLCRFEMPTT